MANSRVEYAIADQGIVIFNDYFVGDLASDIKLTINREIMDKKPGNMITSTGGVVTSEEYELSMTIHKVRPYQLSLLRGQSLTQNSTGTMRNYTAAATGIPRVRAGTIGASAAVGLDLGASVQTSTVKVFNQDWQEVSGGIYAFTAADWTVSGTKLYRTGSLISGAAYPVVAQFDSNAATNRVAYFGGKTGVYLGVLKIAFYVGGGTTLTAARGRGLYAARANPKISSVSIKGSRDSEGDKIEASFKLYADPTLAVGQQVMYIGELNF